MRHRRDEFYDGRKVYGGKRKGNGFKPWNQDRFKEHPLPRNRYSRNVNEHRHNSEASYPENTPAFDHRIGNHMEFREYLNQKYCGKSVNVNHEMDSDTNTKSLYQEKNSQSRRDKINSTFSDQSSKTHYHMNKLLRNQSVHSNFHDVENSVTSEYVCDFVPRSFVSYDELPNQPRFICESIPRSIEQTAYGFKDRQCSSLSNNNMLEIESVHWERQNRDEFRKDRMNSDYLPKNSSSNNFRHHQTNFVENKSGVHSIDEFSRDQHNKESTYLYGSYSSLPDHTLQRTNKFGNENTSYFIMNSVVNDNNYVGLSSDKENPFFIGNVANFSQPDKQIQLPLSKNDFGIVPTVNSSIHEVPISKSMSIYKGPNDLLKGFYSANENDFGARKHPFTENIHQGFGKSGSSLPIQLDIDTTIHTPQIQTNIIQDVSMIPLPPPPPPPPPPEAPCSYPVPSFAKVLETNETQTKCSPDTSVNVVSSTSTDEDMSAVDEQNKSMETGTSKENIENLKKAKDAPDISYERLKSLDYLVKEPSDDSNNSVTGPEERSELPIKHTSRFENKDELSKNVENQVPLSEITAQLNANQLRTSGSYVNQMQHQVKKDAYDKQYIKVGTFDKNHNMRWHEKGRYIYNSNEPLKINNKFHRPWQVGHQLEEQYRFKRHNSYQPFKHKRPYMRTGNEKERLSGLGIHTYLSHEDNRSKRHPVAQDYFRPWEKQRQINFDITGDRDLSREQFRTKSICSSFFTTDLFPGSGDGEFRTNSAETNTYSSDSNVIANKDLNVAVPVLPDIVHTDKVKDLERSCTDTVKFQRDDLDNKKLSSDDLYTKKRQEKYNNGNLFTEIIAVKNTYDQDKKLRGRKDRIESKSCNDVNIARTITKQPQRSCKTLISYKNLSPPSTVAMPILSILESSISKVTSKGLSKVAKPDISLENKSLKLGLSCKTKLGTCKLPCLLENKEFLKTDEKVEFDMSLVVNVDECRNTVKKKCSSRKSNTESKMKDKKRSRKDVKGNTYPENLKKHRLKTCKDVKASVYMKSLHPKLRHKVANTCEDSKANESNIAVRKKNTEQVSTETKDMSTENKNAEYLQQDKNKEHVDDNVRNKSSHLTRGKFVLFTPNTFRVKETFRKNKNEKSSETSANHSDVLAKENLDKAVVSAKKNLLNRALAIEALTRNKTKPLVETKLYQKKSSITSDTVETKLCQRKSFITSGTEEEGPMYFTDFTDSGKIVADENIASIVIDDNNNETDTFENPKEISENSLKLDLPLTEYKPQRTVSGNYATQCLFGPIVSSTYYKAPGKARVIRNSKETITGYLGCHEWSSQSDKIDLIQIKEQSQSEDKCIEVKNNQTPITSTEIPSPFIDVVTVSCNASPCRSGNLSEKDLNAINYSEGNDNNISDDVENLAYCRNLEIPENTISSNIIIPESDSENGKKQKFENIFEDQRKNRESDELLISSCFPNSSISYSPVPTSQAEWQNKYILAKHELADSCSSFETIKPLASSASTTCTATDQDSTIAVSMSKDCGMLPICTSTPIHNPDTVGIDPILNLELEHKSENSIANTSNNNESQYEPSNEEIEMYKNHQLSRIISYSDSDVQRSPYVRTENYSERSEVIDENPLNTEMLENYNCWDIEKHNNDPMCVSEKCLVGSSTQFSVSDDAFQNSAENFDSQCHEDDTSDEIPVFQNPEGKVDIHHKSCELMNIDENFLDTSKNIFEDLVTDILTDVELMSSIPINSADLTNENTNASAEIQTPSTDFNHYQINSHDNEMLSSEAPSIEKYNYSNCGQAYAKTDFKSARPSSHLTPGRKPRFQKRFPKPLPRAKPQKSINAERSLYEAAERFLGDFDHNNKRSCCKVNSEVLINPVSGKLESVKADRNEEQENATENDKKPKVSETTKEQVKRLDNTCDIGDTTAKKMSMKLEDMDVIEPVVTRQQVAMKKLILRSKGTGQMTKPKPNVHKYYKSVSKKRKKLLKGVYKSKEKNWREYRIPSIRLKASKKLNVKGKIAVEKWKNISSTSCTNEKQQKCLSKHVAHDNWKVASIKDEKHLQKSNKHDKSKPFCQNQQKELPSYKHRKKIKNKTLEHSTHSLNTHKRDENKKYYEENSPDYHSTPEDNGKSDSINNCEKKKSSTVTSSPNYQNMRSTEADMARNVRDTLIKRNCKHCSFFCYNLNGMKLHYSKKHANWCHKCKKKFKDKESCLYHLSQSHNADVWCDVCGSTFCHKSSFERHLRSQIHQLNLKFANHMKNKKKRKTFSISDDDDNSVEIIAVSKNVCDVKRIESIWSSKHKKLKTKSDKSPEVNLSLKKQNCSEYVEISEDDGEAKKVRKAKYCQVCKQYYRKMSAHLKTKKHKDMLKETYNSVNQDDNVYSVVDSDMDDVSIHIEDDTQDEDDIEMTDNMSHSSEKSVVIVSDHDGNFEYESDEFKAIANEEDGIMFVKHGSGLQVKHPEYFPHTQIKDETDEDQTSQYQQRIGDNNIKLKGQDEKTDGRSTNVPIVVSACRKGKCSPTLLVRNIAADLMCKDESLDDRLNVFESVKQRYCNISGSKSKNEPNDDSSERNVLLKYISDQKDTNKIEESSGDRMDSNMSDKSDDVYTDIKEEDSDVIEIFTSTDFEVTENPFFNDTSLE